MAAPSSEMLSEFETPTDYLFMNSGSSSIAPNCVRAEVQRLQNLAEYNPTAALFNSWGELWRTQNELAEFLNAEPTSLFLRNNISEAMNNFILGLPLTSKDEIIFSDLEYGAVKNMCRFRGSRDGISVREFRAPRGYENILDVLLSAISPKTKMLVLSHVFTATGLILPIEKLAEQTRKRGIFLVVDGAHAVGALPLDFEQFDNVDCYGGNLHKWIMGPKGTAFGWVHPLHHERIEPVQAGWTTFDFLPEHAAFGGGSRFQGRFAIIGTCDFSSYLAIPEVIRFWRKWGGDRIRKRLFALQDDLLHRLEGVPGLDLISPTDKELRGPLLSYRIADIFAENSGRVFHDLYFKERLQISLPFIDHSRCLRLSPHVYNSDQEIERVAAVLAGYFKR